MFRTDDPASPSHTNQLISLGNRSVQRVWTPRKPLSEATQYRMSLDSHISRYEQCGLIDDLENTYTIANVHEHPYTNFLFDHAEYVGTVKDIFASGRKVLGVWHTHPNGTPWPSPRDIAGWPDPKLNWRYWIVTGREVVEWQLV